jgi:hypothetical protein
MSPKRLQLCHAEALKFALSIKDGAMELWAAVWHGLNFFAPAIGLGSLAAGLTKLLWRHSLQEVTLTRLALWASSAAGAALVAGLVWTGQDGAMVTYGAMVLVCACALVWVGWLQA